MTPTGNPNQWREAGNSVSGFSTTEFCARRAAGATAVSSMSNNATGTGNAIEERRTDGDFVSLNKFRNDGKERAPEDGEADHEQEKIVEQKLDSRETSDSNLCSDLRCERFLMRKNEQTASVRRMKVMNQVPIDDWAKACTELITPIA